MAAKNASGSEPAVGETPALDVGKGEEQAPVEEIETPEFDQPLPAHVPTYDQATGAFQ